MLKLCDSNDRSALERFGSVVDPLAAYVMCRAKCYGFNSSFCETWLCRDGGRIVAALSVLNNNAVLYCNGLTDFEELGVFLRSRCFNSLLTDFDSAEKIGFGDCEKKQALVFDGEYPTYVSLKEADMAQTYSLLNECFPNEFSFEREQYLSWLSDLTFRKNRNFARVASIFEGDELCASALTVAETENAAVVGGVCCKESKRKHGFGREAMLSLLFRLKQEGRKSFVFSDPDVAEGFYKKIGFTHFKNAAYIERR